MIEINQKTVALICNRLKKNLPIRRTLNSDGRLHIAEVEAFSNVIPDGLGGASDEGFSTSTNDIGDGGTPSLVAFGVGNLMPVFGTTNNMQHGAANQNPNNAIETAAAVWSTNNISEAQYTLDLGGTFDVTEVRVFARGDNCCGVRFGDVQLQLLDAGSNPIAGTQFFSATGSDNGPLIGTFAAIPEPGTFALLGLGGLGLLFRRRR